VALPESATFKVWPTAKVGLAGLNVTAWPEEVEEVALEVDPPTVTLSGLQILVGEVVSHTVIVALP
jgi:hypothetical protein